jgi:hypothetical protein
VTEEQLQRLRRILNEQGSPRGDEEAIAHELESVAPVPLAPALEDKLVALALQELNRPEPSPLTEAAVTPPQGDHRRRRRRRRIWGAVCVVAAAAALVLGLRRWGDSDWEESGRDQPLSDPGGESAGPGGGRREEAPGGPAPLARPAEGAGRPRYQLTIRRQDPVLGEETRNLPRRLRVTGRSRLTITLRAPVSPGVPLEGRVLLGKEGTPTPLQASVPPEARRPGVLTMEVDLSTAPLGAARRETLIIAAWPTGTEAPSQDVIRSLVRTGAPPGEAWYVEAQELDVLPL